ncbi:hypothetical protein BDZ89DRAFT_1074594 [Hymenopellis radicata]|nr:hypothetical protein BDZ89DRAFT_1074594 [Hymenopellis radicata]
MYRWTAQTVRRTRSQVAPFNLTRSSIRRTSTNATQSFLRRTFYKADGSRNKTAIAVFVFGTISTIGGGFSYYSFRWIQSDPRIVAAGVIARTLHHIDQQAFASTDFSDFASTMAYFKACVLVTEWIAPYGSVAAILWYPESGRLQAEDVAPFRGEIDAKFDALMAMPEGHAKESVHRRVRTACMSVHDFLASFANLSETAIETICTKPISELTDNERMIIVGIGFGTSVLIRIAWWRLRV